MANPNPLGHIGLVPGVGWVQNGVPLRKFKPHHAMVWPKDGKNGSKWGRMKDILGDKGPDIYMTTSGHAGMAKDHRPLRSHWSQWEYMEDVPSERDPRLNDPNFDNNNLRPAPWVKLYQKRPYQRYDFRSRRYGSVNPLTYSDAVWRGSNDKRRWPIAARWRGYDGTYSQWQEFPHWIQH
ncbi:hypothetical protein EJ05DRAFT_497953 [Pseudovirgaria hyperparasitica]|uniref:Uncharacterized protein n=1 Tax=Pseudovirgaria hyperparasitica TaxID=470096 RepID=A0A6A6WF05_9PEZI|nr:uncharacterized protein EJ05DRAFT_497953 [Pseudovirgaria hyperparasitica]KAF2761402.1 hypothetical protein EJ05DRAFT_497953 [Pseudovirgaria hyperparasitica]